MTMADQRCLTHYVSGSEPFALGHYPGDPVYPGILMIRWARRASTQLLADLAAGAWTGFRCELTRFSFVDIVRPGDVLDIHAELTRERDDEVRVAVRLLSGDTLKARGRFAFSRIEEESNP